MNNIDIIILVNGKPIKTYYHQGRAYVEARYGDEYSIKIRNNNWNRIEAVISVDGIDVIDGLPASSDKRGYIVNAYSTTEIKGFRKDLETVGNFKFTKRKKSYAKQVTGSTQSVGVIGVKCFSEQAYQSGITCFPVWYNLPQDNSATPIWKSPEFYCDTSQKEIIRGCGAGLNSITANANFVSVSNTSQQINCSNNLNSVPDFKVGTTWGKKAESRVYETSFSRLAEIASFEIFYNEKSELEKIGIRFDKVPMISAPRAFPQPFATPPPGWR